MSKPITRQEDIEPVSITITEQKDITIEQALKRLTGAQRKQVEALMQELLSGAAPAARKLNGTSKPARKSTGKRKPLTPAAIEAVARKLTDKPQSTEALGGDLRALKRLMDASRAKRVGPDGKAWSKSKHGGRGVRWVKATGKASAN